MLFAAHAAIAIADARAHRDERRARADLEALVETSPLGVVVFDANNGDSLSLVGDGAGVVKRPVAGHRQGPQGPLRLVVVTAFIGNAGFGMTWGYVIKHVVVSAGREDRDRAGAMLPSTQQISFALGAALTGIIANALGFERMTQPEEFSTAAFWLFGGFVPPVSIGSLIAWRFSDLIAGGRRTPPLGQ